MNTYNDFMTYNGTCIDRWHYEGQQHWLVSLYLALDTIKFISGGSVRGIECHAVMDDYGNLVRV